jgi:3-oxoacyl-[acyl-carrier protein] reductase
MRLKDKVVLITGSSQGLGRGIAMAVARQGAKVVVNARKESELASTLEKLREIGADAIAAAADVSISGQVQQMVEKVVEKFGTLDVLVNNAAITPSSDASRRARAGFLELMTTPVPKHSLEVTKNLSDEEWERIIAVNLTGVFYCMREALKVMEARKYGKIINISSIAGVSGLSFHSPHYSASKAGVVGLTRSVGLEVIGAGINVNCIACGGIMTESWSAAFAAMGKESQDRQLQMIPAGRMGSIEEYANTVVFLASDESSYIVGETINVMGGVVTS